MRQGLFEGALPEIKGKPIERQRGDGLRVKLAKCPVHGCKGRETTWRPAEGLHPAIREYDCITFHHAFYVESTPDKEATEGGC